MDTTDLERLATEQKAYFETQQTLPVGFRKKQLRLLGKALSAYAESIENALHKDLYKPGFEAYSEIGQVLKEIRFHIRKLHAWSGTKRVSTPLLLSVARSSITPEPWGRVLIFAPWNYPLLLLLSPLVGAMSAGNCVTLKPTNRLPAFTQVLKEMFDRYFDPKYIALVTGGHEVSNRILTTPFDYIFFTGSQNVGKQIMKIAAERLVPVTLELGGKNPCIVCEDADLKTAARRIVWGKYFNAGQTCVAPDFVAVHKNIRSSFLAEIRNVLEMDYGKDISDLSQLTRMVSTAAARRQTDLLQEGNLIAGGISDVKNRLVGPAVVEPFSADSPLMTEEIFGPVLPVVTFDRIEEVYEMAKRNPNPLSLYIFTKNRRLWKSIMSRIPSGGVAVNDTVLQFVNSHLPLGGRNQSGIGVYHGYYSFRTFSHFRSVYRKRLWPDFRLRYPPYTTRKYRLLKFLLR